MCVFAVQEKYQFTPTVTVVVKTTGPKSGELQDPHFSK